MSNDDGIIFSAPSSFGDMSDFDITLPSEVGGVEVTRDMEAIELVTDAGADASDPEAQSKLECSVTPAGTSIALVICDIRRLERPPGLEDEPPLALLVGLGRGCESNMWT